MNNHTINAAVEAAERFLSAVNDVLEECVDELPITGTRRTGELRRRSMDLTRALADLRRPA